MQDFIFQEMTIKDYQPIFKLWQNTPGIGLSAADSRENIEKFLERNPGMSYICKKDEEIVGTILAGHDGRRGYIYQLMVIPNYRKQGIAQMLIEKSLSKLYQEGIDKCHLFVLIDNEIGKSFWTKNGWMMRQDIFVFSKEISDNQK